MKWTEVKTQKKKKKTKRKNPKSKLLTERTIAFWTILDAKVTARSFVAEKRNGKLEEETYKLTLSKSPTERQKVLRMRLQLNGMRTGWKRTEQKHEERQEYRKDILFNGHKNSCNSKVVKSFILNFQCAQFSQFHEFGEENKTRGRKNPTAIVVHTSPT